MIEKGGLKKFNKKAEEFSGYSADYLKRWHFQDLFADSDKEKVLAALEEASGEGESKVSEVTLVTKNQQRKPTELFLSIYHRGKSSGLLAFMRDIAYEKKQFEQLQIYASDLYSLYKESQKRAAELEKLNRMRTEFLLLVSHEFKTTLTSLKIGLDLLAESVPRYRREALDVLNPMRESLGRLERLIFDLLEAASLQTSLPHLKLELCDIKEEVLKAKRAIFALLKKKRQRLRLNLPSKLPPVMVDKHRLQQILE